MESQNFTNVGWLMRGVITKVILVACGLFLALLSLEGVIFRFIFVASDMPEVTFSKGLVRYKPNQQGIYRKKNEIAAPYSINSTGWNSKHFDYRIEDESSPLIAIIGDSYVEALQVPYQHSIAEQLEESLGEPFRVYRFGISGAPFSQYLEIFRQEVMALKPSLVIINVVHNDFKESYEFKPGAYTSSFMKLGFEDGNVVEIPARELVRPWYWQLRNSAAWRFLVVRYGIHPRALKTLFSPYAAQEVHRANIVVDDLTASTEKILLITQYLVDEFEEAANQAGVRLLFVVDGDRQAIYEEKPIDNLESDSPLLLNRIIEEVCHTKELPLVDLHPVFSTNYRLHKKSFNFASDFHWNMYGHAVAAKAIKEKIVEENLLSFHSSTGKR